MKTIFFDFDGTLTYKSRNVWVAMWQELGYDTGNNSYYRALFNAFSSGDISHQEWCDLTCEAFMQKEMNSQTIKRIADEMRLVDGFEKTIKFLKQQGYELYILSGNTECIIRESIGESQKYFNKILANKLQVNSSGMLEKIVGTDYDFQGKATYIKKYIEKTGISPKDVVFVGNGSNDEWVYESGCRTICVNPDKTDINNKKIWHCGIENMENLEEIIPLIIGKEFNSTNCETQEI